MKRKLLSLFSVFTLSLFTLAHAQQSRTCNTMENLERLKKLDPAMVDRMAKIEEQTALYIQNNPAQRSAAGTIYRIPVVVHIVYNTTAENITDAQVQSQITVLNEDFRKMNADVANTPSLFAGLAADAEIEFCLATVDPNGAATTGITRTSSTVTAFSSNDNVKRNANGGKDPWNTANYMNIWSCDLSGGLLGYAQFPGGPAATDGIVIDYAYFGRGGSAQAPFNLGRTATHEVGHYLNLRHIWGDALCGNDQVSDTPTQQTSNGGCPTFPHPTCTNTSDMFMNYMDYVNDNCMYMFSTGQSTRMRSVLATGGAHASLTTSPGCGAPPTGGCTTPSGLNASNITTTTFTLNWAAVSGAASYDINLRAAGGTFTSYNATTNSIAFTGATAGTTYEWQVRANCAGSSSTYSAISSFSTTSTGPTYCASKGNSTADEWIQKVVLGSINNTSGNNAGYANYTSLSTNLVRSTANTITITPGWTSTKFKEAYRVWIDYNQDGDFVDAGEQVFTKNASMVTPATGSFTVPSTALLGTTRMRVSMKYNALPTSCEAFAYGEVEDYTVNIVSSVAKITVNNLTSISNIQLYPNPANTETTFAFEVQGDNGDLNLKVFDVQGKLLEIKEWKNANGIIEHSINTENMPVGIYHVILQGDHHNVVRKLVIAR